MAIKTVTFDNKSNMSTNSDIPRINKVIDDDINQLKDVANTNATNIGDTSNLSTSDKSSLVNSINELLTNFNSLFKFQQVSQQVTISGNGNIGTPIADLENPTGYTLLGILPKVNGYGDQWQVTYSAYNQKVYAYIKSYYGESLTSTLQCTVVYINSDYLNV